MDGMRRGSWAETSITSTASPSVCTSSSACHSGTDPPGETTLDPWLDDPFPDYDTEPVMAFSATYCVELLFHTTFVSRGCHILRNKRED